MVVSSVARTGTVRARRTGTADTVPREQAGGPDQADGAERPANRVDHYSLALQLIQVFPIISGVVLALVTVTWLARVLAAAGLLVGTLYVLWHERGRRKAQPRGAHARRAASQEVAVVQPVEVRAETRAAAAVVDALLNNHALGHRDGTTGEYEGEYRGVSISIRISSPASSAYRQRYRRQRLRERRSRPAPPPASRPALFRHEIGCQPEMTLGIVDD